MTTADTPATFKFSVNYVLVRVVVRDGDGKVVKNLKKEDFLLTDNRKPQIISTFAAETPASHVPTVKMDPADMAATGSVGAPVKAPELPSRFITLFFDDLHLSTQDAMLSRQAAMKLFAVRGAGDRISVFTTSGQVELDYTSDQDKLEETLQRVMPRPLMQTSSGDCPPMTFYEAYQIVEANDPVALQVATADAMSCSPNAQAAALLAQSAAQRVLSLGESQLQFTYQNLESLIRRMTTLPGQRIIVLMSPGFFVTPTMRGSGEIIDRATKANIVVNTIDARGLYVSSLFDASNPSTGSPLTLIQKSQFIVTEESLQDDVLGEIADGTGGVFFHNRNDIDQGLLQAAAEPEVSYVLGFAPQNLKLDGSYHRLKVTLANKQKWAVQARHGYFAPRHKTDPEAAAKEEIEQAIFSQEEMHELPMECQTQFFRSENGVRLSVVTHVTTAGLKFRKVADRSNDDVTVSTAIFDENGNLLTGQQKTVYMKLRDITLSNLNRDGFRVKSTFDLQPGTFLVRVIVRDSEGAQMGAVNRGVVIP
ncbi:MAG TPA: VWA domain-containing protein [Candidatus Angelobacter sp.]|nr:VWA domain-containing protein [Candidatus Angelobacter sp.]